MNGLGYSKVDGTWPFIFTLSTSQVYLFAVKVSQRYLRSWSL